MSSLFLLVKWMHILSATVLFGTGIGTAFHMWFTYRRGDVSAFAITARNVVLADWLFTVTSGALQVITGVLLIIYSGYRWSDSWLVFAYILYIIAFACWVPVMLLQIRVRRLAEVARRQAQPLPPAAHRYMRIWFALGWPAFIALLAIFLLMVLKPVLW